MPRMKWVATAIKSHGKRNATLLPEKILDGCTEPRIMHNIAEYTTSVSCHHLFMAFKAALSLVNIWINSGESGLYWISGLRSFTVVVNPSRPHPTRSKVQTLQCHLSSLQAMSRLLDTQKLYFPASYHTVELFLEVRGLCSGTNQPYCSPDEALWLNPRSDMAKLLSGFRGVSETASHLKWSSSLRGQ